jgi:hypothetical protein
MKIPSRRPQSATTIDSDQRSCCASRFLQSIDQIVELFVAHEAAHGAVIDQQHGRIGACALAFAGLQSKQAISSRFTHLNAQTLLQMNQRLLTTMQLARQIVANVQLELAQFLLVVHVVKSSDFVHSHGRHAQPCSCCKIDKQAITADCF